MNRDSRDRYQRKIEPSGVTRQKAKVVTVEVINCMCGKSTCRGCGHKWASAHGGPQRCPNCSMPLAKPLNAKDEVIRVPARS
jgi:rubrerythrin